MRAGIAIERGGGDLNGIARERVGERRLALHDAGIAETRLGPGDLAPVEDHDAPAARLQRQSGAKPDESRAQHDAIDVSAQKRALRVGPSGIERDPARGQASRQLSFATSQPTEKSVNLVLSR